MQRAADLECRLGDAYLRFAEQQLAEQRLSENLEVLSDALHQHEQMQSQHAAVVLQFQERIRTLEQRLFWPLVARKARGALRRLRATLAPRSQVEQRAA